ncbi:hypothetical protein [Paractinoplanes durhamensis]|uniref:PH domain-containing protein n=1 Tax=Paractinoplanes durhamensis TaxID=113563 RepID=A0ABQ3YX26_9ACTN|nr:hypothetical protein [Actinoplanes durhamensis]GIE01874.1 hypothetical protein Adu01nite_32240 [Actinoplanes durhamensis]
MLIKGYAAIARRPQWFMVGSLVVAVLLGVGVAGRSVFWPVAAGLLLAVVVVLLVLSLPAVQAGKLPRFLLVRRGMFVAPVEISEVLAAAVLVVAGAGGVAYLRGHGPYGPHQNWQWLLAFVLLVGVTWRRALRSSGMAFRPDGVVVRSRHGKIFIPWQADPLGRSASQLNNEIALLCRWPGLARMDGNWRDGPVVTATADVSFLARVIHEYAGSAGHRAAIGTPAELSRLSAAVTSVVV